jgi:hypothetical protein
LGLVGQGFRVQHLETLVQILYLAQSLLLVVDWALDQIQQPMVETAVLVEVVGEVVLVEQETHRTHLHRKVAMAAVVVAHPRLLAEEVVEAQVR